jgi:hypothetical protein
MISIMLNLGAFGAPSVEVSAEPATNHSYVWFGEVVMYDEKGKTVIVKAPYLDHINRYIGEFTRGDKVMLNWATTRPGETEAIRFVGRYDATAGAKWGYILPVEFVSADTTARRLTFRVAVPSKALRTLKRVPSGGWIKVTTPFDQPNETAAIVALEASTEPQGPQAWRRAECGSHVPNRQPVCVSRSAVRSKQHCATADDGLTKMATTTQATTLERGQA